MMKQTIGCVGKTCRTIAPYLLSVLVVKRNVRKKSSCDPQEDFALIHYLWKHVHIPNSSVAINDHIE